MGQKKILSTDDLEATPTEDEDEKTVTSEWAFDHNADADAHHSEEIPEGRAKYNATERLMLPGTGCFHAVVHSFTLNRVYYSPIKVDTPITIDQVTIEVTTAGGGGTKCRTGVFSADINWQPDVEQVLSAEIAIDAIAVVDTAITETTLQEGRYLIAYTGEDTATLRTAYYGFTLLGFAPTLGTTPASQYIYVAKAYAALDGTAWDTIVHGVGGFRYSVFLGVKTP